MIAIITTIKGTSIIIIKSTGSLHANEDAISIAATNITANPAVVAIAADSQLLRILNHSLIKLDHCHDEAWPSQ
jgi:hypothetical protein